MCVVSPPPISAANYLIEERASVKSCLLSEGITTTHGISAICQGLISVGDLCGL